MSSKEEKFVIDDEKDYTTTALVDYLNDKYEHKKTGKKFTLGDIQQYLKRGFLPKPYGHHPIERIEIKKVGLKLIRVHFDKTVK